MTNQQAEVLAAAFGLHCLPAGSSVTVFSDSEYVVNCWAKIHRWRDAGWRRDKGGPVANVRHWERLLEAAERHREVSFQWVRGHDGIEANERADELAGAARQQALALA